MFMDSDTFGLMNAAIRAEIATELMIVVIVIGKI